MPKQDKGIIINMRENMYFILSLIIFNLHSHLTYFSFLYSCIHFYTHFIR